MPLPDVTSTELVSQNLVIEPLGGPATLETYLQPFPDNVYDINPYSRLVYLLYTLMGPAGVGSLRKQYLQLRLMLEDAGFDLFLLDKFYGDPLGLGRLDSEILNVNVNALMPKDLNTTLNAYNANYRNRIIDFFKGAKRGNTKLGLEYVAKTGLGHACEIIENYQYLFNAHCDDPKNIPYYGSTDKLEEIIVLPRRDFSSSAVQSITITGDPTEGSFQLGYNGQLSPGIDYNATSDDVQGALEAIPALGVGQVFVTGGPGPLNPWFVRFTGTLANQVVPLFTTINFLLGGGSPDIEIDLAPQTVASSDELADITPRDRYYMREALDRVKPMTTIPTVQGATGTVSTQLWRSAFASSKFVQSIKYVTGSEAINWPTVDDIYWIEGGKEKEAPHIADSISQHYEDFHQITGCYAYGETALTDPNYLADISTVTNYKSEHIGGFGGALANAVPFLASLAEPLVAGTLVTPTTYSAGKALAVPTQPIGVTDIIEGAPSIQILDSYYPDKYLGLAGIDPTKPSPSSQFWSSLERASGSDYLEIDLGQPQAVNFISFEMIKTPFNFEIDYDLLDQPPSRRYVSVTYDSDFPIPSGTYYRGTDPNPWEHYEIHITNSLGEMIYTRYIRIRFSRRLSATEPFLYDNVRMVQNPWSVQVRNLRVGRSATDS